MQSFNLKIVTPHGVHYEDRAEAVTVRTKVGDVSVWANHIDMVTALGIGKATVTVDGKKIFAACSGGVLSVLKGDVTVLASTFEWREDIDRQRVRESLAEGKEELKNAANAKETELAKRKVQRAIVRDAVKNEKI